VFLQRAPFFVVPLHCLDEQLVVGGLVVVVGGLVVVVGGGVVVVGGLGKLKFDGIFLDVDVSSKFGRVISFTQDCNTKHITIRYTIFFI
jgi:hypothetical protein